MNIIPFDYEGSQMRVVKQDGEAWWIATDVCAILEHSDVSKAVSRLDEDEKLMRTLFVSGQNRNVLCINEPGLYSLILTSRKPEAKAFKRWVTHEVLPAIRKTGSYSVHEQPVQGGIASDLAAILSDQKSLKKFVHALNDLQEVLYPKNIQEVPTQSDSIKQRIMRVLTTQQGPMSAAVIHSSWIKNTDTEAIREACDEMVDDGLLTKQVSKSAKQGKYLIA